MKISSKQEFHSLVKTLKLDLTHNESAVKTSRLQELFAQSLGYKSANGLYSDLPKDFILTEEQGAVLSALLAKNHNMKNIDGYTLLKRLENEHKSYSTRWRSDQKCYPSQISKNENYWYLTKDGWLSWDKMDFSKMRVELNIYKVVHASSNFLGGFAKPIWTADIGGYEFGLEAGRLESKFGEWPCQEIMYPVFT